MAYRAIQDTVAYSESLNALTAPAERLYWRLLAYSDSHGRLPGSISKVRARCIPLVPATGEEIEAWLGELAAVGRVQRYGSDGTAYLSIVDFDANQPPEFIRRRGDSKYPSPPPGPTPEVVRSAPENSRLEGEGEGEGEELPAPSEPRREVDAAVRSVYGRWRQARGKANARYDTISPARRQKIVTRLREFSEEELRRAIDAVDLDPWAERPRHDDLTVIFRNREQVDKFLEFAERPEIIAPAQPRRPGVSIDDVVKGGES